jgi:cytochrome o ubiquinol oxidase operon protein cyoD
MNKHLQSEHHHTNHTHGHLHPHAHASVRSYLVGFIFSLALTFIAYFLVMGRVLPKDALTFAVVMLCVIQLGVQLVYFLHLGDEKKPYWNLQAFVFMATVLLIILIGTLWIMYDLYKRGGM